MIDLRKSSVMFFGVFTIQISLFWFIRYYLFSQSTIYIISTIWSPHHRKLEIFQRHGYVWLELNSVTLYIIVYYNTLYYTNIR